MQYIDNANYTSLTGRHASSHSSSKSLCVSQRCKRLSTCEACISVQHIINVTKDGLPTRFGNFNSHCSSKVRDYVLQLRLLVDCAVWSGSRMWTIPEDAQAIRSHNREVVHSNFALVTCRERKLQVNGVTFIQVERVVPLYRCCCSLPLPRFSAASDTGRNVGKNEPSVQPMIRLMPYFFCRVSAQTLHRFV